jgi:hypothetical protein
VVAAPIIIAAVCKDGVAIIAAHPPSPSSDSKDENGVIVDEATAIQMDPLLYYRPSKNSDNNDNDNNDVSSTQQQSDKDSNDKKLSESTIIIDVTTEEDDGSIPFVDIPIDFGGPYRINNIGRISTDGIIVVSCGWRPDCQTILDHCETLLDNEIQIHGRRVSVLSTYTNDYTISNRLVNQLSYYKAQCAVSERVRFSFLKMILFRREKPFCSGMYRLSLIHFLLFSFLFFLTSHIGTDIKLCYISYIIGNA